MYGGRWFFRPIGSDGDVTRNEQGHRRADKEEAEKSSARSQEEANWHKIIWEDFLPTALTMDVPYELFWHLNPTKLKAFQTAFDNKRRMRDEEMWLYWGTYGISAFSVVLASAFSKNSQSKYVEKPIYQQIVHKKEKLTEEEKIKQTEQLFMQLQIMGVNHKSTQKSDAK